jgi:hypothetical protein
MKCKLTALSVLVGLVALAPAAGAGPITVTFQDGAFSLSGQPATSDLYASAVEYKADLDGGAMSGSVTNDWTISSDQGSGRSDDDYWQFLMAQALAPRLSPGQLTDDPSGDPGGGAGDLLTPTGDDGGNLELDGASVDLVAVPEPASMLLLGSGLLGGGLLRRRRNR